jgi:hypothetical protein
VKTPGGKSYRYALEEPAPEPPKLMSGAEEERGDAMYWLDRDGVKHYD